MALKVELKPGERIIVGDSVITNGEHRATLIIDGDAPILREKDVLRPEQAESPAKRIYFTVQCMYLEKDLEKYKEIYFSLTEDIVRAAPSTLKFVDGINNWILTGNLYKALKEAKALVAYEGELLSHV